MRNAKQEFLEQIKDRSLICAQLNLYEDSDQQFLLKRNYTQSDLETFLQSLDFEYDSGYGGQELFGFIWHSETTWSERGNYDGAEWWDYKEIPVIPDELK
jgi:hypothetical protein